MINYGKKRTGKKYAGENTGKYYGGKKARGKNTEKSHVTSGDVTSGQACAMVRSPSIPLKYGLNCAHILLTNIGKGHLCLREKNLF